MSFTQANRREVESLIGKLTTVGDTVGRVKRDIEIVRRFNPQWDERVLYELGRVETWLSGTLGLLQGEQLRLIDAINALAPQE